jgi:hypothetical protein
MLRGSCRTGLPFEEIRDRKKDSSETVYPSAAEASQAEERAGTFAGISGLDSHVVLCRLRPGIRH